MIKLIPLHNLAWTYIKNLLICFKNVFIEAQLSFKACQEFSHFIHVKYMMCLITLSFCVYVPMCSTAVDVICFV